MDRGLQSASSWSADRWSVSSRFACALNCCILNLDATLLLKIAAGALAFLAGLANERLFTRGFVPRRDVKNWYTYVFLLPAVLCAVLAWQPYGHRHRLGHSFTEILNHDIIPVLILAAIFGAGRLLAGMLWKGEVVE